ncbi:MAG TPA: alpha/beta hydrolase [Acidimicrobiales bacterium]|nr:alpha/beta hydrolase [Acidimicrobiales bacterium]
MSSTFDVGVRGGALRVGRWGDSGPVVLAVHGITGNHKQWAAVGERLAGRAQLVAPDLRGRGSSSSLPGPLGMATHAADMIAVLDHLGVDHCLVVGHSMGGYVAAVMAERHPDRVSSLLLIDGGPALPVAEEIDVDATIDAVLGPSIARLKTAFATRDDFIAQWRAHPALADAWNPVVEGFIDYEIVGAEPALRSSVSWEAMREDSIDTLVPGGPSQAVTRIDQPVLVLRAEAGMFGQPPGLLTDEVIDYVRARSPQLRDELVPGTNHYTIVTSDHGAEFVANHILSELALT